MDNIKELLSTVLPVKWFGSLLPEAASTTAERVDKLFYFITWSSVVLFFIVVIPLTWFAIKYRRKKLGQKALSQKDHNTALEITWSVLPLFFLAILFVWGFNVFLDLYISPRESKQLRVIGQKWQWTVQYPEEEIEVSGQGAVIGVRLGQPVKLVMTSQDVLHSFFVPNFRVKQDVIPGRYTTLWFEPNKEGEFPVFCAEYCGDQHSQMMAMIKVMKDAEYEEWREKIKGANTGLSPIELGAKLFVSKGCNACHTTDGIVKIGPSFKGLYGKKQSLTNGTTITVDDSYIHHKVMNPQASVAQGYPPVMPSFKGQLSEKDIAAIIEFIKSLK